ncbi:MULTISPECIES: hypothetical protein [Moorena]|uniref:Uncharacterized protein n=2 Tax=Moorena TaxID=1155738 RepID=F4XTN0_9CYAN|nr:MULTISPECIES: hypothetical protein [Moorena]EGJ31856.1 hypothetical protein LYNGBM3L_32120 [Moorena producens 3L]NEQ06267.1 hypothetical protein [Moorena sp. SIO4E2]NEQ12706.1 hypothetical protein [Moorena sp. SIO3E2]NER89239.1 hypothetical protein [Moorena sp. SIO3A2]
MVGRLCKKGLKLEARPRNLILQAESAPPLIKASLSYGNYRQRRRLAVGHAKGEREQTMSNWRGFPHERLHQDKDINPLIHI